MRPFCHESPDPLLQSAINRPWAHRLLDGGDALLAHYALPIRLPCRMPACPGGQVLHFPGWHKACR